MINNYARELKEYKTQSINTMTQGELLLLLYDNLIKRLKKASILIEHQDFPSMEKEVAGCRDILKYLTDALDHSYPISGNLKQLYDYFNYQLIRLTAGRNRKIVDELIPMITELRESFHQADRLARQTK